MIDDFKICPQCGKKFTKEEYFKENDYGNEKQKENWWNQRKYCCYDCSTKFNQKIAQEKRLTRIKQYPFKWTAPIEIWKVESGDPVEIKILLYGREMIFKKKNNG